MPKPAEVTLPSDREVRVTRTFNAPRQLVWDAHTRPELVPRWQGYDGWDMPVCDMDVRVGGKYKWQWRSRENGKQMGFFGTFTEVNRPSKLVHEQYFDATVERATAVGIVVCDEIIGTDRIAEDASRRHASADFTRESISPSSQ